MPVGPFIHSGDDGPTWGIMEGSRPARHRRRVSLDKGVARHMTFQRQDRPLYAGAPRFRQSCAKCIRTHLRGRVRTSSQKLICSDTRPILQCDVAFCTENKWISATSASRILSVLSHIAQQNQPPAAPPTALLLSRPRFHASNRTLTDKYPQFLTPASGLHRDCIRRCCRTALLARKVCS